MIKFITRKQELERLYSQLIDGADSYRNESKNQLKDYVLFGAIAGNCYKQGGLMVIGKSTNGWHRYDLSIDELFGGDKGIFDYPEKLTILRRETIIVGYGKF